MSLQIALPFWLRPTSALVDGSSAIDGLRMIKSPSELALMGQAKAMTLEVHRRAARILAPGIRASEVKLFLDRAHRALGAGGSRLRSEARSVGQAGVSKCRSRRSPID